MTYDFTCPKCSRTKTFTSKRPYEKNVAQGCCSACLSVGTHQCLRCDSVIKFVSREGFTMAKEASDCRKCKKIPTSELDNFKKGIFSRHCPKCKRVQTYSSKGLMLAAKRLGHVCHSCASKKMVSIVRIKRRRTLMKWSKEKRAQVANKISIAHKIRYENMSDIQKEELREQLSMRLKKYYKNITPAQKASWHRKLKAAFVKHRGDNHWMKNPEVLQKMKDSCVKYRGDNHWCHRLRQCVGQNKK